MTATSRGWLDEVISAAAEDAPLLVLCRTSATARAVYRRFAEAAEEGGRRGWANVEIATLGGLAQSSAPGRLRPERGQDASAELPPRHPWRTLLESRPGLRRLLRQHLGRVHETAAAGVRLDGLRPELRRLLDAGWGRPDHLEGALALQASPPAKRCIAVGFAPGSFTFLGSLTPLDRALLDAIKPKYVAAGSPIGANPGPLEALRLPDTVAEARAVAREAAAGGRVLVLVADTPTEERIKAALRRNGIAVGDDASEPLTRHSLCSIVSPLLPLFQSRGVEPVDARDLLRLFTDPVLSRRAPKRDFEEVEGVEQARASVRHVRAILVGTRRTRATVDEWVELLAAREAEAQTLLDGAEEDARQTAANFLASARILLARMKTLAECARGEGKLGDVAQLLSALELADPENDRLGRAVIRALREDGHRPADADAFADALARSVASRRVDRGVQVLAYAAYDGRDCDLLLLTGVHDKGLARAPGPDPLLTPAELELLGMPGPRETVRERLALARWAASRAKRSLALVTDTDASGRKVTPPVELALRFTDKERDASYGLGFELPERRDRAALGTGAGTPDALTVQIDAEWARQGAAFEGQVAAAAAAGGSSLVEQIERDLPRVPEDLRPFLGEAGHHPAHASGLPPEYVLSASRMAAFSQCLYRAFCESVLRLKPVEEIEEDLDAREVGSAVHAALEHAMQGVKLLVPEAKLEAARAKALEKLRNVTRDKIEEEAKLRAEGADTPPLAAAREGLAQRWSAHWEAYLAQRIGSVEAANEKLRQQALKPLKDSELLSKAVDAIGGVSLKRTPRQTLEKSLLAVLADCGGDLKALLASGDAIVEKLAACNQTTVLAGLKAKGAQAALQALCEDAQARLADGGFCEKGDLEIVGSELPFGAHRDQPESTPLALPLGREPIPVRGKIDAVLHRRGTGEVDGTVYRVVDFKTGGRSGSPEELVESLTRPQLAFYALALQALDPVREDHAGPVKVEGVELDFVRATSSIPAGFGEEGLRRASGVFGALIDRARDGSFPLVPHPNCCPQLGGRAYCDFAELCRLRAEYVPEQEEGGEP